MNEANIKSIIQYGIALMQQVTTVDLGKEADVSFWSPWTEALFSTTKTPGSALLSLWSLVGKGGKAPVPARIPTRELSLAIDEDIKTDGDGADSDGKPTWRWQINPKPRVSDPNPEGFVQAVKRLGEEFQNAQRGALQVAFSDFDHFYYLMQKYANTLPCTYGELGVSLFQQWRMIAAVMALATGTTPETLPNQLALIGLDLPGIQNTVYTIASRKAGKSVRGRSAFVQLLVNAIVDRIVRDLGLCRANVIVNAGGNALILAGWSDGLEARLRQIDREINELLLYGNDAREFAGFQGDLAFAFAWIQMPWSTLKYPCETVQDGDKPVSQWQWYEKHLKEKLRAAKNQPFGALLQSERGFHFLFDPEPIDTNRCCAVCQRPENKAIVEFRVSDEEESDSQGGAQLMCPLCGSFVKLADSLGKTGVFLNRSEIYPSNETEVWQTALYVVSGYFYTISSHPIGGGLSLALSPDEFPRQNVHGFWPLATTTPLISQWEIAETAESGQRKVETRNIRDNSMLAEDSPGTFKRLAILKADVDDLGPLLAYGLGDRRSAALTATLSESLTLFFGGWLDKICAEEPFRNKVYVLYAGGDDLLIIGTWHVIPQLAARLAGDFALYTGQNPSVHLSAGISIAGGKEPLYAAIDAANRALKQAKRYPNPRQATKNAICFMDKTVDWRDFGSVEKLRTDLQDLINRGAPQSMLMTLLQIYAQYQDDRKRREDSVSGYTVRSRLGSYGDNRLYLGPWLWQMIYRLPRMMNTTFTYEEVSKIQKILLESHYENRPGGVEKLALSARWVQLQSRKEERSRDGNPSSSE